ncbi:peptide-methionine (S)-S-oxide reductase MsrA [Dinghuibacter silviterrae]|nr:peptide-methionine (S)-S-oxide reductase MsrA [Dinghuibacter silviterrae]
MKTILSTAVFALLLGTSCAQTPSVKIPRATSTKPAPGEKVATFSEGCFWHAEIVFQSLEGVRDAVSGYSGGTDTDPTYEKVETGETGHAETVNVYYDPARISYETLVKAFFASQDPTEVNRQGNDVGTQYRSVAFYRNDQEKATILAEIKRITPQYKAPIATQVVPFEHFYPAEAYHQEYIYHHPENPYVEGVSIPDYLRFRQTFPGPYKAL